MNNEPVAWMTQVVGGNKNKWDLVFNKPIPHDLYNSIPLYTHPAKTLTDEEIAQAITDCGYEIEETVMGKFVDIEGINMYNSLCGFARAILRKAQGDV